jgi:hypothetical protein
MPRDGSGVYSLPFPDVVTATPIASTVFNGFEHDIATDLNAPRPIVAGGTGATSAAAARTALLAETYGQVITNYDSASFLPGSFYSDAAATSPPVVGHAFVGVCAFVDGNNMYLEAFDRDDAAQPGARWIRQKKAGVWSSWAKAQALNIVGAPAANQFTTWQSSTALQGVAITGLVKGNGASAPTAAVAATDYAPATSGTAILKGNGAGGFANAVANTDYATVAATVAKAGDTMTGLLVLSADPGTALGAATRQYVDAAAAGAAGRILSVKRQVFTANGTYTPSTGMVYAVIDCVGGGGGGGGVNGVTGGVNGGGGGGGGGFSRKFVIASDIGASKAVVVGVGGTAGPAGTTAGAGGQSSVGATICTGNGGSPGGGVTGVANFGAGGIGGIAGTGDFTILGQAGGTAFYSQIVTVIAATNHGGSAGLGYGAGAKTPPPTGGNTAVGVAGSNYGGGGSGGMFVNVASNVAGGAGAPGLVVITEFCTS